MTVKEFGLNRWEERDGLKCYMRGYRWNMVFLDSGGREGQGDGEGEGSGVTLGHAEVEIVN